MNNKQNTILTEYHVERNQLMLDQVEKNSKLPPISLSDAIKQYQMIKQKSTRSTQKKENELLGEMKFPD